MTTKDAVNTSGEEEEIPWHQVDPEIRKDRLSSLFVKRNVQDNIYNIINSARTDSNRYIEAQNVAIIGETGVGKTEIAKRYLAENPEHIDPETGNIVRPVLYVDVRHSSTPKAVAQAMLRALLRRRGIAEEIAVDDEALAKFAKQDLSKDDPEAKESYVFGGATELSYRVKKQMVGQGVRVAILDEFHNTITDNGAVRLNRIAEWVKDFAKAKERSSRFPDGRPEERISMVIMGTTKIENIIDATVNPELASITPYRAEIPRYRYKTPEEKKEFQEFLYNLDFELPFDEDSGLGNPLLSDKIHTATFGLLRPLGHIITKAAELAIDDGAPHIFEHHLYRAVEMKRGVLESPKMSRESTPEERVTVINPFTPPVLEIINKPKTRTGYTPK